MKKYRLPAFAGTAALAAAILAGCGSPSPTFEGREVKDLDKTIESLDSMWAQNRADGTKSNVDEDSRCYAQVTELAMSDSAICGPIHYLGEDDQAWEAIDLSFMPSGDKAATASVTGEFSRAERAENATLFRPDGKESPEDLMVPEPDAETAKPEQAIWDTSGMSTGQGTDVYAPGITLHVSNWKVSERVGSAENRLEAGDGRMFASVTFADAHESEVPVELAFATGGKSYPLGAPKTGSVSMSLPGDAKDAVLEVTAEGNTQTLSLETGEITSTASAYYDGLLLIPEETPFIEQEKENGAGQSMSFRMDNLSTVRDAYEEKQGWAPEGKTWLIVDTDWYTTLKHDDGYGDLYDETTKITSATVEGLSGEMYTAEAVRIDNVTSPSAYNKTDRSTIVFEVPAGVGDFKVNLTMNAAGPMDDHGFFATEDAPESVSIDDTIDFEVVFARKLS